MKKLMEKKVSLFGKEFGVFALVAVSMMAIVSAALVPYLSNTISVAFNTESPLFLEGSADGSNWDNLDDVPPMNIGNIHGGEIATVWLRVTNNADADVASQLKIDISSNYNDGDSSTDDGATCNDFAVIEIKATRIKADGSSSAYIIPYDSSACDDNGAQVVVTIPSQYLAGEIEKYEIALSAALNIAPSTYTVTAQEMVVDGTPLS